MVVVVVGVVVVVVVGVVVVVVEVVVVEVVVVVAIAKSIANWLLAIGIGVMTTQSPGVPEQVHISKPF